LNARSGVRQERVFHTLIRWARFGELFEYDETSQRIHALEPAPC
jgi:hypothetical protein